MEKERITTINLVPTHLVDLREAMKTNQYDLSSLRAITYGAAPMPIEVLKRCTEAFGNIFIHLYGLTETTSIVTYLKVGGYVEKEDPKQFRRRTSSFGREGLNMETSLVHSERNDVQPGEVGEIIFLGLCVMKGYWMLPEETEKALKNG